MSLLPSTLPASMAQEVGSTGASEAADIISRLLEDAERHLDEPVGSGRQELEGLLANTYIECSQPNWDGYGAKAVELRAFFEAQRLVDALPSAVVKADVTAEPSGALAFEWRTRLNDIMVASVLGKDSISYAVSLSDGSKDCGVVRFFGTLPRKLAEVLVENFGIRKAPEPAVAQR